MAQWIQFPRLEIVDVVEPDADAVQEYQHRLLQTHRGMRHKGVVVLPNAQRFRFHGVPIFDLIPSVAKHRCNMAVLSFSISQIVSRDADADALLGGLLNSRNIPHIVIMAHDHTVFPLPETHGVRCTVCGDLSTKRSPVALRSTNQEGKLCCKCLPDVECNLHPLLCTCPDKSGQCAQLTTNVIGSTTARKQGTLCNTRVAAAPTFGSMRSPWSISYIVYKCFESDTTATTSKWSVGPHGKTTAMHIGCYVH